MSRCIVLLHKDEAFSNSIYINLDFTDILKDVAITSGVIRPVCDLLLIDHSDMPAIAARRRDLALLEISDITSLPPIKINLDNFSLTHGVISAALPEQFAKCFQTRIGFRYYEFPFISCNVISFPEYKSNFKKGKVYSINMTYSIGPKSNRFEIALYKGVKVTDLSPIIQNQMTDEEYDTNETSSLSSSIASNNDESIETFIKGLTVSPSSRASVSIKNIFSNVKKT